MLEPMMKMMVGQQIGSYHLNKFLGAGSFGGVFQASEMVRHTSVQEVAVKVIPESSDDKLIELQNARKLNHANLVQAYSVGEFNFMNTEMLYLVMELAQDSLENHIEKGGLSPDEIKKITIEVAQGLNYLHNLKKVHRDLKPGNILKVNKQYKLADFGLIKTLNSERSYTATVHTSGTILYMPPEAFKREVSPAWDMWSLGIMLIQMTTNKCPYRFDDINQLMARVIQCELEIPSLPTEFKPIIEGCLQKERSQRWTAQQVLNALQPVIQASSPSSQKIQISSPSQSEQPQTTGKMPVSQIPLKTAKADFNQLDQFLKNGQWREADQETANVILKIMGREKEGWLTEDNCQNFPREELKIIDQLWVKYSNGKFGFSVQKKIWLECGGKVGVYNWDIYQKFAEKIGWLKVGGYWLRYSELTFNTTSPQAHLPYVVGRLLRKIDWGLWVLLAVESIFSSLDYNR